MQLDLVYTLRLIAERNLTDDKILSDDDSDAVYSVDFHMDDYDASTNIEHILNVEKYHPELADVKEEDITAVEDDLRSWLEKKSADNTLIVKDNSLVDVCFKIETDGIKFRFLSN